MPAPWKPIVPGDWIALERIVNDIWGILNEDTSLSDMVSDITVGSSDLALVSDALSDTESEQKVISDALSALTVAVAIGGSDTEVQYNDGGAFGADSTFTFNDTSKILTTQELAVTNDADVGATATVKRLLAGGVTE